VRKRALSPTAKFAAIAACVIISLPNLFGGSKQGDRFSRHTLLVSLHEGVSAERLHREQGALQVERFSTLPGIEVVRFAEDVDLEGILGAYKRSKVVKSVSLNYLRSAHGLPNDPLVQAGFKWEFQNTGQIGGVVGADVDASAAWETLSAASGIIVAVLDTGIRYTHEDLAGNMWVNPGEIAGNGIDDDDNGYIDDIHGINAVTDSGDPMDDQGHGTHVAGIIGSVGNNGVGLTGIAWDIEVMALKFLDSEGNGTDADAIDCIDYAIQNGVSVINSSWGGGEFNQVLKDAIEIAGEHGIFFVAAAGNEGIDNDAVGHFPSSYELPNVVSVTATDRKDELADFANFGEETVDLAAPGKGIYSCYGRSDSDYRSLNGSSMAAPCVSGAIGLLKARFPNEAMPSLLNRLLASVDPLESLARRCRSGGRLNLSRALMLESPPPVNDQFTAATDLRSSPALSSSFNTFAGADGSEPLLAASASGKVVWWKWKAEVDGKAELSTVGSDFATVVSAFRGTSLSDLLLIGSAEDLSVNQAGAELAIDVVKDESIYIAVDGLSGSTGNISLNVGQAPVNDDFSTRIRISGINSRFYGHNIEASAEAGEEAHAGFPANRSIWWEWVSPLSGKVRISTAGTSAFDTRLSVYTGGEVGALALVAENDDAQSASGGFFGGLWSELVLDAVEGEAYQIAVDGWIPDTGIGGVGEVTLTLVVGENDTLNETRIMKKSSFVDYAYSEFAKKEIFEPDHASNEGGRSLWWEWRPARTGPAFVSSFGSDFDTTIGVYQGDSMNALSLVGENDDDGGELASRVVFDAVAGESYRIAVDGFRNDFGVNYGLVRIEAEVVENPSLGTPIIESPESFSGMVGVPFALQLEASPIPSSYEALNLPPGLVIDSSTGLISGAPTTAGLFGVRIEASNDRGTSVFLTEFRIEGNENLPEVSTIASSSSAANGGSMILSVATTGDDTITYQWRKGGELIVGANASSYEVPVVTLAEEAQYSVTVSNASGSVLVGPFEVDVVEESLANISTRGWVRSGDEVLITGFFIRGDEPRDVLIRAVGPTLGNFGLNGVLENPKLVLKDAANATVREVDDWQSESDASEILDTASRVGAFALSSEKDAALIARLTPGLYSAIVSGADGGSGIVLAEVYDAATNEAIDTRLINLSTRLYASNGDKVAIGGFHVKGSTTKRVLIRVVGPTLGNFGLSGFLNDPYIELYRAQTLLASNDSWKIGGEDDMKAVFASVGAFPLDAAGREAAIVVDLPPGSYSVQAVDAFGGEGVCLIEVYEIW